MTRQEDTIEQLLREAERMADEVEQLRAQDGMLFSRAAKVVKNGNQTINAGAGAKLTGWAVEFDEFGLWDAANNQFVINQAGIYVVELQGILTASRDIQARIRRRSGATQKYVAVQHHTDATPTVSRFTAIGPAKMATNDEVDAFIQNDNGASSATVDATITYSSYDQETYFAIWKIA